MPVLKKLKWVIYSSMKKQNTEIDEEGTKRWYNEVGELHRTDGPAVEWANGAKSWWLNGMRHRTDGPAFESPLGSKIWWYYNEPAKDEAQFYDVTWRKSVMFSMIK